MAITMCEALKKIRLALGVGAVTPEALAAHLYETIRARSDGLHCTFLSGMICGYSFAELPEDQRQVMLGLAAGLLQEDAGAEIRAILDEVNDSLPEIYRA